MQKRQVGAGDVEGLVFYTAVGKEVLQVVGEEVGNADGLHFSCQMGVLQGTPDLPVLFKVTLFGTEAGPAGMGGKMLGAAGGEDGVCRLLQKLRIEGGHGDGVGEDGGGSGTGHVVGDFVPPVKFADV
mgnify:CR=1 FL=1